jgi:FdrA protein
MSEPGGQVAHRLLAGAYRDSLVLMQLQQRLEELPGVEEAGAVMATAANRELLAARGLLPPGADAGRPDDLLVAVRATDGGAAEAALARVEELLAARRGGGDGGGEHRPRSLGAAFAALPEARWVLVSVPGRWAPGVARDALAAGRHVFLYSDNVPLAEEVALKAEAARRGLLVLGPDCGTAWIAGTGLGFANRVRRGRIGLVAASGTGAQAVACGIDARSEGISHGLGTGGRDLSAEVGGATALAALDLLGRDAETEAIVLVSKPPAPEVAARVLAAARRTGKPVVVWFLGAPVPAWRVGELWFATGSEEAAELAVRAVRAGRAGEGEGAGTANRSTKGQAGDEAAGRGEREAAAGPVDVGWLRGLFCGGTLAAEAAVGLAPFLAPLAANFTVPGVRRLEPGFTGHTIVDLGADEMTVGKPHPMIDPTPLVEQLRAAAADPRIRLLLFDVVLGDGAHPDPAGRVAPALEEALAAAREEGRELGAVAILVGTAEDPQDRESQVDRLRAAGARVVGSVVQAVADAFEACPAAAEPPPSPVDADALAAPLAAVNVGLETFHAALLAQGAAAVHLDWRPPAGGDDWLARILERAKGRA